MKILIQTPSFSLHGGIRVLCEWASRLIRFGHEVTMHSLAEDSCGWFPFPSAVKFQSKYNATGFDCLIIGSPHGIELADRPDTPPKVFIFCQMLEHMFKPNNATWQAKCRRFYTSPHPMFTISRWNEQRLKSEWGRTGPMHYVGNGVNLDHFPVEEVSSKNDKLVLVEGWESHNPTKDADNLAAKVAKRLRADGYEIAAYSAHPLHTAPDAVGEYHYKPGLNAMNDLYRRAAILLKASKYDARACAPMEAMTKGTPTVRALVEGDDDLIHGKNSIRVPYHEEALYRGAKHLLINSALRRELGQNCLNHVREFSWDFWMDKINRILVGEQKQRAKSVIVSVVYLESEWQQTRADVERCAELTGAPVVYVNRNPAGIGSLADAINRGFRVAAQKYDFDYVWFVTNVRFGPSGLSQLEAAMEDGQFAAIHPAFDSDHVFCRKQPGRADRIAVPFVEFTAPIVRRSVMEKFPLDETMPYWGHDLGWGMDVRAAGFKIGVDYGCTVEHVYIRNKKAEKVTEQRKAMRRATDAATKNRMHQKYGADWRMLTGLTQ